MDANILAFTGDLLLPCQKSDSVFFQTRNNISSQRDQKLCAKSTDILTLDSGINVAHGTFGKNNKRSP